MDDKGSDIVLLLIVKPFIFLTFVILRNVFMHRRKSCSSIKGIAQTNASDSTVLQLHLFLYYLHKWLLLGNSLGMFWIIKGFLHTLFFLTLEGWSQDFGEE